MLPYFTIFGREIPLYGVCYFVGLFAAASCAVLLCKERGIQRYDLVYAAVFAGIGGAVGAKLLFLLVSAKQILALHLPLEAILKGGFVFYGGLLGGMLGAYWYAHHYRLAVLDIWDLFAIVLPFGHAFGRVGCFFSGCCYGIPYDGWLSYTYTYSLGGAPVGVPLLPLPLIEAACLLLLFALLLGVYLFHPCRQGVPSLLYLMIYPPLRFVLEFFRGDAIRGHLLSLSTSQWISLLLLAIALPLVVRMRKQHASITGAEAKRTAL